MSKTKSIFSLAAGLAVLVLACVITFPLAAAPQMGADGPGVTVDTGGAVLHRGSIPYPDSARAKHVQGVVTVEATLDGSGNVVDTRVLNGPIELRRAAQQSVLNWHFAMDTSMNTRTVKVTFELPAQSASSQSPQDPAARQQAIARLNEMQANLSATTQRVGPSQEGKRVNRIYIGGLSDQSRSDLMSHLQIHVGDTLGADSLEKARAEVKAFDEHLTFGTVTTPNGEVGLLIQMPGSAGFGEVGITPTPFAAPATDGTKRITVGGNIQQAKLVSQVRPVYPPLAKQARISGVVRLTALIGKEGNVINMAVMSGHPLLIPSALEAVQKWVYQTTLLNGDPVEVITQIDVNYTLSDDPPVQQ